MGKYKINYAQLQKIYESQQVALKKTALNIDAKIIRENVVPMDEGHLQLSSKVEADPDTKKVTLSWGGNVTNRAGTSKDVNYAAKQYMGVNFNHSQGPHAGTAKAKWADSYLKNGSDFPYVQKQYRTNFMKSFHAIGGMTNRDEQRQQQQQQQQNQNPTSPTPGGTP